jgi:hypothetical protein
LRAAISLKTISEIFILESMRLDNVAEDNKFLSLDALALEPMVAAAGPIGQVHAFGDDPFESESAGMLQHGWPVHFEMLAEANERASRQAGEELMQQRFTVLENRFCQIELFTVRISKTM